MAEEDCKKEQKEEEEIEECPEDKSNEKEIIKKLLDREEMKTGETWYLISRKWFRCWKEYVGYDIHSYSSRNVSRPDEISNNELMIRKQNGFELRETLISEHDYTVISAPVWKRLQKWCVYSFISQLILFIKFNSFFFSN